MRFGLPKFTKGDRVSAGKLNKIVETIQRIALQPQSPGASAGLEISQDASGTRLRVMFPPAGFVMFTSGGISARASGVAGSGTATFQSFDPSNGIADTGVSETVYNWNSASGGVGTSKYFWASRDANGYLWVVGAEC